VDVCSALSVKREASAIRHRLYSAMIGASAPFYDSLMRGRVGRSRKKFK